RERVLHHRQEARVVARLRDALRETDDDPRAHETLRLEGLPQICPRRGDRDRRERDAVDGGKPHHAAAVGDAERADPVRVDVRPRQEPVEELDRVHCREVGGCDVWRRPRENGGSTDEGEGAEHRWPAYATDTIGGWIRGRWASSTRGWAGSPSSTSVWSRFRTRTSSIWATTPGC